MAINPRLFEPMVITDTCSVWNILSSKKIWNAVKSKNITFCITRMVLYECSKITDSTQSIERSEMINRLENARAQGSFAVQECDAEALLDISRIAPPGALGSGELSCIATAYTITSFAVMTDDKKARQYAENKLNLRVETTPKLYSWLHFNRCLTDIDHPLVIAEHTIYERRPLTKFFEEAYIAALEQRSIDNMQNNNTNSL